MDLPSKRILTLFIVLWLTVLFLSQLAMYGFMKPTSYTVFLLLISVFSCAVGFCSYRCRYEPISLNTPYVREQVERLMNNKIFTCALIAFTLYMFSMAAIYYEQLVVLNSSLSDIRGSYFDGKDNIYGPYFGLLDSYIMSPFVHILSALFGYCLFYKRDWKLLLIFVSLFIYSSLGGGRFHYIRLFLLPAILGYFVFYKGKIKLKLKTVVTTLIVGFAVFFLLAWTTMGRRADGMDKSNMSEAIELTTQDILTYAYGPILAFEYSVEHNYSAMIGGYQYGRLTLHAIDDFFVIGLGTVSGVERTEFNPSLDNLVAIKQDSPIPLGGAAYWNALYTWNLYFYNDFGIVGLFVFPFLIGLLSRYIICMLYKYNKFGYFIILTFLFRALLFSFIDYTMTNMMDVLVLIAIFIFNKYKFVMKPAF